MYQDVADLNAFYRAPLGQVARRLMLARFRALWPDVTGARMMGLGYATPYLRIFQEEAERVLAFAPAAQGVLRWPQDTASQVCLTDEFALPLADESMDRILMIHVLEHTEARSAMMREVWRVMAPGGRLLVAVANRRGIWSRADHTPFGHGSPFNDNQIDRLLRDSMFTPLATEFALYVPPSQRGLALWSAPAWERLGRQWGLPLPGVVLVEATKQMYGAMPATRRRSLRQRMLIPSPSRAASSAPQVGTVRTPPARQTDSTDPHNSA